MSSLVRIFVLLSVSVVCVCLSVLPFPYCFKWLFNYWMLVFLSFVLFSVFIVIVLPSCLSYLCWLYLCVLCFCVPVPILSLLPSFHVFNILFPVMCLISFSLIFFINVCMWFVIHCFAFVRICLNLLGCCFNVCWPTPSAAFEPIRRILLSNLELWRPIFVLFRSTVVYQFALFAQLSTTLQW